MLSPSLPRCFNTSPEGIHFRLWAQLLLDCHKYTKSNISPFQTSIKVATEPLCSNASKYWGEHVIGIKCYWWQHVLVFSRWATEEPCEVKHCWGGGEPNPAGAETRLSVIIQGSHPDAKRRGHQGQTCLTEWTGLGRDAAQMGVCRCTGSCKYTQKKHSDCQVGLAGCWFVILLVCLFPRTGLLLIYWQLAYI